jgi:phosphoribosylglycinamide formyltransferase-1
LSDIFNLIVDLRQRSAIARAAASAPAGAFTGVDISPPSAADDRTLAWIDEVFGGSWSSEAAAGLNVIARRAGAPVGCATLDPKGLTCAWLNGIARERDVGIFGPFGVAPGERKSGLGMVLLRAALDALRDRGYARALIPAITDERLVRYYADSVGAGVAERFDRAALLGRPARTLVMASGNGSNFQAVLDAARSGSLPLEIVALVSNNPRAYAIERARAGSVRVGVVTWNREEEGRAEYDARLLDAAWREKPDLVLLLGWMHLLDDAFVRAFPEMLNLHPAFLPLDPQRDDVVMPDGTTMPAFRGPRAVSDALATSSRWVGATLHRVTSATDRGPVLVRKPIRIAQGETPDDLTERLHAVEHRLVVAGTTRWLYERRPTKESLI